MVYHLRSLITCMVYFPSGISICIFVFCLSYTLRFGIDVMLMVWLSGGCSDVVFYIVYGEFSICCLLNFIFILTFLFEIPLFLLSLLYAGVVIGISIF